MACGRSKRDPWRQAVPKRRRAAPHPCRCGRWLLLLITFSVAAAGAGELDFDPRGLDADVSVLKPFIQDVQGDGLTDFVFLAEDGRFLVYLQREGRRFERGEFAFPLPEGVDSLDVGDADGDGVADICLTVNARELHCHYSGGDARFWENLVAAGKLGTPSHTVRKILDSGGDRSGPIADLPLTDSLHRSPDLMWDLDGDGRLDLFIPRFTGLEIWRNPASAEDAAKAPFAQSRPLFFAINPVVSFRGRRIDVRQAVPVVVDLQGDGRSELVFAPESRFGLGRLELSWLTAGAEGRTERVDRSVSFGQGESVTEYLLDDLNEDGLPDMAVISTFFSVDEPGGAGGVTGGEGGGGGIFQEKRLKVYLGEQEDGDLADTPVLDIKTNVNLWQEVTLRADDLDGDGKTDLCLYYFKGILNANLALDLYSGLGGGRFKPKPVNLKLDFDRAERGVILPDTDIDGDGGADLVLLADGRVQVFRRRSAGDPKRRTHPFETRPAVKLDPLTAWPPSDGGSDEEVEVTLSLGSSGGSLSVVSNQLSGLTVRDLDGDGRQDLVVSRRMPWDEAADGRPPLRLTVFFQR